VEPPGEAVGDQSAQDPLGGNRHNSDFQHLHRNKRSLSLNLKSPAGREVLLRLVDTADVLIENMRPPVKERLGFDFATVHARNPQLVYGSLSGFGQDGPYGERGGVDQIAQGMGGLMSVTGLPGTGPMRAGIPVSDLAAGLYLAIGVLVALHERDQTGTGRWVQTSLLESMIAMMDFQAVRWTVDGRFRGRLAITTRSVSRWAALPLPTGT
jgi:crotonobetainyl-CoA:carnitine CoA-transferase CaiB-like acyl-CoA transferase